MKHANLVKALIGAGYEVVSRGEQHEARNGQRLVVWYNYGDSIERVHGLINDERWPTHDPEICQLKAISSALAFLASYDAKSNEVLENLLDLRDTVADDFSTKFDALDDVCSYIDGAYQLDEKHRQDFQRIRRELGEKAGELLTVLARQDRKDRKG